EQTEEYEKTGNKRTTYKSVENKRAGYAKEQTLTASTVSGRVTGMPTGSRSSGRSKTLGNIVIVIILLAVAVFKLVDWGEVFDDPAADVESYENNDTVAAVEVSPESFDIYENMARELSEEGESFEISLTAGQYVVGCQLPEGKYTVRAENEAENLWFSVEDEEENYFYNSWWISDYQMTENGYEIEDVRLYNGAVMTISGAGTIHLQTVNGQTDQMKIPQANPLTEQVYVSSDLLKVGKDLEAGVYDVKALENEGIFKIRDEEGYEMEYYLDSDEWYDPSEYHNMILSEGDIIYVEPEEFSIVLIPSEEIYE
ncbi:MAG: hypothetical protein ACI4TF_12045, partial [Oliverpabstia sp.]